MAISQHLLLWTPQRAHNVDEAMIKYRILASNGGVGINLLLVVYVWIINVLHNTCNRFTVTSQHRLRWTPLYEITPLVYV